MSSHAGASGRQDAYHGIVNVDKPHGWTSHDVVARLRRLLGQRAIGHAGTLDPMATGVLLVCLGRATRVAEYLTASRKIYRATARLGVSTDTYDATGQVVATASVPALDLERITAALLPFVGEILQAPPAYSAVKQDGIAAYRRARRGDAVELPPRPVIIYGIDVLAWQPPDLALEITCGPGTYIRSLAHDLGRVLGCGAHLAALVRTRSGSFSVEDAAGMDRLAEAAETGTFTRFVHPISAALAGLVPVPVDQDEARCLAQGRPISCPAPPASTTGYAAALDGEAIAILQYRAGQWWPHKVFVLG